MMVDSLVKGALKNQLCKADIHVKKFQFLEVSNLSWNSTYSEWIKTLPKGNGVYLFSSQDVVLYIGMSGKVSDWPISTRWDMQKRLKASRGTNNQNKDVSTVKFIQQIVTTGRTEIKRYNHIDTGILKDFQITILYCTDLVPPSYLEAVLLFNHLAAVKSLPDFNLSF